MIGAAAWTLNSSDSHLNEGVSDSSIGRGGRLVFLDEDPDDNSDTHRSLADTVSERSVTPSAHGRGGGHSGHDSMQSSTVIPQNQQDLDSSGQPLTGGALDLLISDPEIANEEELWDEAEFEHQREMTFQEQVYGLFSGISNERYPGLTMCSHVIFIVSIFFIVMSCVAFAVETLPDFVDQNYKAFDVIEMMCSSFFTAELLMRFVFCPSKLEFLRAGMNWIDLFAILPFYLELILDSNQGKGLIFVRVVRLVRVMRVMKLSKHSVGIQAVVETFARSTDALALLIVIFVIAVVIFSSAIFFAETSACTFSDEDEIWITEDGMKCLYQSIPETFWWCTVTITTVGYGDVYPVTGPGKIVATVTLVSGIFVIAFPTIILGANFQEIYARKLHEIKRNKGGLFNGLNRQGSLKRMKKASLFVPNNNSSGDSYGGIGFGGGIPRNTKSIVSVDENWIQPRGSIRESGIFFMYGRVRQEARPLYTEGDAYVYDPIMEFRCIPGTTTLDLKLEETCIAGERAVTFQLLLDTLEARKEAENAIQAHNASNLADLPAELQTSITDDPTTADAAEDHPNSGVEMRQTSGGVDGDKQPKYQSLRRTTNPPSASHPSPPSPPGPAVNVRARHVSRIQVLASVAEFSPLSGTILTTRDFTNPIGYILLSLTLPAEIEEKDIATSMGDISFTFALSYAPQATIEASLQAYQSSGLRRTFSTMGTGGNKSGKFKRKSQGKLE